MHLKSNKKKLLVFVKCFIFFFFGHTSVWHYYAKKQKWLEKSLIYVLQMLLRLCCMSYKQIMEENIFVFLWGGRFWIREVILINCCSQVICSRFGVDKRRKCSAIAQALCEAYLLTKKSLI